MSELVKWMHGREWVGMDINLEPSSMFMKSLVLISPTSWGLFPKEKGLVQLHCLLVPFLSLIVVQLFGLFQENSTQAQNSHICSQQELHMFRLHKKERLQTTFPGRISMERDLGRMVFGHWKSMQKLKLEREIHRNASLDNPAAHCPYCFINITFCVIQCSSKSTE